MPQLPDRQSQLRQLAYWLVQMRSAAAAAVLILTLIGIPFLKLLPSSSLPWLLGWSLVLLASNVGFQRLIERPGDPEPRVMGLLVIDLVILTGLLNASGGLENPLYLSYVFPVVVAATLLSRPAAFAVAVIACFLFCVLVVGEASHILPHVMFGLFPHSEGVLGTSHHASHDGRFIAGKSLSLVVLVLITFYLTSLLRDRLRDSEEVISTVAREALLEHERLEGVVQAAGVGMMVVDLEMTVQWLSRRVGQWLGWHPEVRGSVCPLYQAPEGCQICVVARALHEGRAVEVERRVEGENGSMRFLRHAAEPVKDSDGRVLQVVELVEDVTRRKALEAEALHAGKLTVLGQLAAGLAHEIGNPLASLATRLKRLEREREPAFLDESLELLKNHIERIKRTVRNVSLFSRNRPAEWATFTVEALVEEALELIRLDRRARGVSFERIESGPCPPICGVRDQLVQILVNLLLNALESMPDGGTVRLATLATGAAVEITVSDTGQGLEPDVRRRIFEPFFTTKQQGVGLGLAISKSLVEAHGGDLRVRSAPGKGSSFTVSLPRHISEER